MAFNGSGTFVRVHNWVTDKNNSIPITASRADAEDDGIATGLSTCIAKDGQTTVTANIPFNTKKITGLGDPTSAQDAATKNYADSIRTFTSTDAGATAGPTITAYRNSASPADDDLIGEVAFDGEDDGGNQTTFAKIYAQIKDATDTTEDGALFLQAMIAGTLTTVGQIDANGLTITDTIRGLASLYMTEQAAAAADTAGDGQFWIKTQTPNIPMFTDDAGNDFSLNKIVGYAYTLDGAVATTTQITPLDDTIPQIGEGGQMMTVPYTPTNANNILKIEITTNIASTTGGWLTTALHQDAIANSLASVSNYQATWNAVNTSTFTHYMVAGTTSLITFRVRCGNFAAGTLTFNGTSSGRLLGGVFSSSIAVTEIAV